MSKSKQQKEKKPHEHKPIDPSENLKDYLPKKPSDYAREPSKKEQKEALEFEELKKHVKHQSDEIPPLSQSEREHLTYLRVMGKYNELKAKQKSLRKYGTLFILCSAVIYLLLMFSLETKIEFLVLWIATVLFCIFLMIRADYNYHTFKELLGIADEYDFYDYDEDENEEQEQSQPLKENIPKSETKVDSYDTRQSDTEQNNNTEGGLTK